MSTQYHLLVSSSLLNLYQRCLFHYLVFVNSSKGGGPHGVMVKAMDCGIIVSEFVLQLRYYVHFRANTLGKGMNPLILPAMD